MKHFVSARHGKQGKVTFHADFVSKIKSESSISASNGVESNYDTLYVSQTSNIPNKETIMYSKPKVTVVGGFNELTKGAGKAREKDLLGFRALIVIHWPWA